MSIILEPNHRMFTSIMQEHQSLTCIDMYVHTVVIANINKGCLIYLFEH